MFASRTTGVFPSPRLTGLLGGSKVPSAKSKGPPHSRHARTSKENTSRAPHLLQTTSIMHRNISPLAHRRNKPPAIPNSANPPLNYLGK